VGGGRGGSLGEESVALHRGRGQEENPFRPNCIRSERGKDYFFIRRGGGKKKKLV